MRLPMLALLALAASASASAQMKFSLTSAKPQYRPGEPIQLTWKLYNGTGRSWVVYRATVGIRENFPQITFHVEGPSGRRELSLQGAEKATAPNACRLAPGQTLGVDFDLTAWMSYLGYKIAVGKYGISATISQNASEYRGLLQGQRVGRCGANGEQTDVQAGEIWDGTLTTPTISFSIR